MNLSILYLCLPATGQPPPLPSHEPPRAHLPKGAPYAEELVDDIGRYQDHGREGNAPPDPVGPGRINVVIIGERLEVDDADHHHKLQEGRGQGGKMDAGRNGRKNKIEVGYTSPGTTVGMTAPGGPGWIPLRRNTLHPP